MRTAEYSGSHTMMYVHACEIHTPVYIYVPMKYMYHSMLATGTKYVAAIQNKGYLTQAVHAQEARMICAATVKAGENNHRK